MNNVLVIGLGVSGRAAVLFLLKRGCKVTAIDRNEQLPNKDRDVEKLVSQGMVFLGENHLTDLSSFDLVVVSPGVPPSHPCYQQAKALGIEIIGEIELACRELSRYRACAITGTNGKTTVTLMVEHLLNQIGISAKALGNVGEPLTTAVDLLADQQVDLLVVELSSFQLETLHSRPFDAAVLLNITPDHLDRYPSMQEYALAKVHLAHCLKEGGKFFVEERCYREFSSLFSQKPLTYGYDPSCTVWSDGLSLFDQERKESYPLPSALKRRFSHDLENCMAVYLLCQSLAFPRRFSFEQFFEGISSFKKPAHRIEFVSEINGVRYIDDSKGTNIDAVIRAVESVEGTVLLIAGGVDKGFPYTAWISPFTGKVRMVLAIGQSKEKICCDLSGYFPVKLFDSLEEAVRYAGSVALKGDVVLLSPGCSSYDMYKNYAARGLDFQRVVQSMGGKRE